MQQEVFRNDAIGKTIFTIAFFIGIFLITFLTNNFWYLLLLAIPSLMAYVDIKDKLVIENGVLRYEKAWKVEEIPLNDVVQFLTQARVRDHTHSNVSGSYRSGQSHNTTQIVQVVDKARKRRFEFAIGYIADKNRRRFEETVLAVNGNIKFTVASLYGKNGKEDTAAK